MLLLQGLSEFLEKYAEVAAGLTGRGFEVYSFDWRGQGHSPLDGAKAPGVFARHLSDLHEMLQALPAGPLVNDDLIEDRDAWRAWGRELAKKLREIATLGVGDESRGE